MTSYRKLLIASAAWLALTAPAGAQFVGSRPGMMNDEGMRVPIPKAASVDLSRATVADGFTFLAAGDLLGPQSPLLGLEDTAFGRVVKLIQGADVAFANHEGSAFELNTFSGTRAAQSGGGYPLFSPALDREFKAMGLDIVSMANNHAGDWGQAGLLATLDSVSRNRSTNAAEVPAASAAATSSALAARIFSVAASNASAIAPSAASLVERGSRASSAAAVRARPAAARTSSRDAVAARASTSEVIDRLLCRRDSAHSCRAAGHRDEVVGVHHRPAQVGRQLGQVPADQGRQLGCVVRDEASGHHQAVGVEQIHHVAGLEIAVCSGDPGWQK